MGIDVIEEQDTLDDHSSEQEGDSFVNAEVTAHNGQIVTVGCWLTIKEIALVIGTLAHTVLLRGRSQTSRPDNYAPPAISQN